MSFIFLSSNSAVDTCIIIVTSLLIRSTIVACCRWQAWFIRGALSVTWLLGWVVGLVVVASGSAITAVLWGSCQTAALLLCCLVARCLVCRVPLALLTRDSCVKPTELLHKLNIWHVSELRIVLKSTFYRLAFDWTHANFFSLSVLKQLAVMSVLKLNHLMHIRGRWCRSILHTSCMTIRWLLLSPAISAWVHAATGCLTGLQLWLLSLLIQLAVLVRDLEDFSQALRRLKVQITCRRVVRVFSLTLGRLSLLEKVKLKVDQLNVTQILGTALCVQIDIGILVVKVTIITPFELIYRIGRASLLEDVKNMQAVVLVKFEGLAILFRAWTVFTVFFVILLRTLVVFIGRGVLEKVKLNILVLQDAIVEALLLVNHGQSWWVIKSIDHGCEILDGLGCLWARELFYKRVLPMSWVKNLIDNLWRLELRSGWKLLVNIWREHRGWGQVTATHAIKAPHIAWCWAC